jgi:hypothetical protein
MQLNATDSFLVEEYVWKGADLLIEVYFHGAGFACEHIEEVWLVLNSEACARAGLFTFVAGLSETKVDVFAVLAEPVAYLLQVIVNLFWLPLVPQSLLDTDDGLFELWVFLLTGRDKVNYVGRSEAREKGRSK